MFPSRSPARVSAIDKMSSSVEEMEAEVAELPPHGHKSKQKTSAHETIKMNDEDEQNVEAGKDNDYDDEVLEPDSELSHRLRGSRSRLLSGSQNEEEDSREGSITVLVSGPARPWEYRSFDGDTTVDSVLDMVEDDDGVPQYRIEYESGRIDHVSQRDRQLFYKYPSMFMTLLSFFLIMFCGQPFCTGCKYLENARFGGDKISPCRCRYARSK